MRMRGTSRAAALGLSAVLLSVPAGAGTLSGVVRYDGEPPAPPTIFMSADPACDRQYPAGRPAETLVVGAAGGLANTLVYVKKGLPEDLPATPPGAEVTIDQIGCAYVPHVLGVRTGQVVAIHNSDATIHNVDARAAINTPFNDAMPAQGLVLRKAFATPEVAVKLKCDIHPWMSAYVGVFDHPYFAVTGADGRFSIAGLPEGEYTVEAWHESLGTRSAPVEIDDDETTNLELSYAGN